MAAIPKDLMESEPFGHEGAFTGAAAAQRRGRFEQADGVLFPQTEIGDTPADTQTRLPRVLADGEFYWVGGHAGEGRRVIIAATHQNLESLVRDGVPRGPVPSPERDPHPHPAAGRPPRGHPGAGPALPQPRRPGAGGGTCC
ncbi:sigma 54-interacting transcriptional regulator [Pseudomonas aeruginosa]